MYESLFTLSLSLFILMDPIGNIPVYISLLKNIDPREQRFIIVRELLIALGVIIAFKFMGRYLLDLLRVSQETILLAGGIILFIIALKMIFSSTSSDASITQSSQAPPFIVPLAIPLVAGPSVLAAVMIYSRSETTGVLVSAICIAWTFSTLILFAAPSIKKILGARGVLACEKLMGLLLTLMAIQMFLEGVLMFIQKC